MKKFHHKKILRKDLKVDTKVVDERKKTENEKLITNYKKIIAPVKTGETVDLDKIKEQEKNVEASRRRKKKKNCN